MISSKQSINRLAYICHKNGIKDIIFSAGSRNAPVVIAFTESGLFNCLSIPDERVAAFVAMGMAQASGKPTLICCTSGSAAANYTPAICEAYYQGIPMIVLTADRPVEMIDQGAGQSIRQYNMYNNFIKASYQFIQEASTPEELQANDNVAQKAVQIAMEDTKGPVHINLPFKEPLYQTSSEFNPEEIVWQSYELEKKKRSFSDEESEIWRSSKRKMILYGMDQPNSELQGKIQTVCSRGDIVLLTETCSNILVEDKIECIDRVITTISKWDDYQPDLLITIGGPVISKKIKKHFLHNKPIYHWDVYTDRAENTFQALTHEFQLSPSEFLEAIEQEESVNDQAYITKWRDKNNAVRNKHEDFISSLPYSDMSVFKEIIESLPTGSVVHLANSTPVRYAQLFDQRKDLLYLSNRGVSGIDGCTSTALGYALAKPDKLNIVITGDLAFFYDSNAFFHQHQAPNLKVIMINNSGGGIFRIIEGPSTTNSLDKIFESKHSFNAKGIADTYGIEYSSMDETNFSVAGLFEFLNEDTDAPAMLEIKTPNEVNDKVLKQYFEALL